ncbi:dipeptidyl-peptidase 3 family protein [Christiangramia sp. OXR-203]|jgi:dipeptidyl-peptidase-3|uniref:dipeptidyl-peptidase 3 family protein n=1 Tax=Christiangramia sp. OXR-203 TaxID=3100176 RepID=UPI002AC91D43|nr:dihydrofolate reductase [Christiangramia sp. OXR-203]WPY98337.1 dihydrofolate reductase [Christiangramia sp. OXR-203]
MNKILSTCLLASALTFVSCNEDKKNADKDEQQEIAMNSDFEVNVDEFADIKVLRYQIPGWENLSLKEQKLVYYLTQAGLAGRDIMWDQNYRHNLEIREALENIYTNYEGDQSSEEWSSFETYLKRVWFSNGIHHHYSNAKIKPEFSKEYFDTLLKESNTELTGEAYEVIFNDKDAKKVNLNEADGLLEGSAINFYGPDVTAAEVDAFYAKKKSPNPDKPLSYGLNSKLVKENGKLVEKVYKSGGLYGEAIDEIIKWLEKAKAIAENEKQANALGLLIDYYTTGDLKTWDDYNVAWVEATEGNIDYINSFIEVYNDPKGYRGSYENIVQIKDFDMSKKMSVLENEVQWFEDNSPIMDEHKKDSVVGVTYKTVIVAGEAGDASPSTPIGVNLPNANWIRKEHGSKSVSLGNIISAYESAGGSDKLKEFAHDEEEVQLSEQYGKEADKLHTALHEVVGHASGQMNAGVGETKETLKNYASTLEEGRADLVGLYYLMDPKLEELGLTDDSEKLGKAAYNDYIRNGLMTQLVRIEPGQDIEEAHMRNRQWVSKWVYEKGQEEGVIEKVEKDGKIYFDIKDYQKLRSLFGDLLKETQRIKSEGDFQAAKDLVENYGVKVDQDIHKQVLDRNSKFKSAPYSGFVNPVLVAEMDENDEIISIKVTQPRSFEEQMLDYSENYSFLTEKKEKEEKEVAKTEE